MIRLSTEPGGQWKQRTLHGILTLIDRKRSWAGWQPSLSHKARLAVTRLAPAPITPATPFPTSFGPMKSKEEVIAQFNEEVNMTMEELETWLEDPKSEEAGTGVGIESGHKIVEILKKNPAKDPEKYDEVRSVSICVLVLRADGRNTGGSRAYAESSRVRRRTQRRVVDGAHTHQPCSFRYNKRHLAQEDHLKETKTREELENAKSTISLKNWGHVSVGSIASQVE